MPMEMSVPRETLGAALRTLLGGDDDPVRPSFLPDLADAVLARLALPENQAALIGWLIDLGVLVQPDVGGRVLCASVAGDGEVGNARFAPRSEADMTVPLYRPAWGLLDSLREYLEPAQ